MQHAEYKVAVPIWKILQNAMFWFWNGGFVKNMAYANRNGVGISHYLANSLKTKWLKPSERNLILNDVFQEFWPYFPD